jgi:hypothetical protein
VEVGARRCYAVSMSGLYDMNSQVNADLDDMMRSIRERGEIAHRAARHQLDQAKNAVVEAKAILSSFEETLNANEEVRLLIVGGPSGIMFFPHTIEPIGNDRLLFVGIDQDGQRVVVIQHVSQLNLMMKAAKVDIEKPRRTGFHHPGDNDQAAAFE